MISVLHIKTLSLPSMIPGVLRNASSYSLWCLFGFTLLQTDRHTFLAIITYHGIKWPPFGGLRCQIKIAVPLILRVDWVPMPGPMVTRHQKPACHLQRVSPSCFLHFKTQNIAAATIHQAVSPTLTTISILTRLVRGALSHTFLI